MEVKCKKCWNTIKTGDNTCPVCNNKLRKKINPWGVGAAIIIAATLLSYLSPDHLNNKMASGFTKADKLRLEDQVKIKSLNWRADHTFTSGGAVIWSTEVANLSNKYLDSVRVEFTTYDIHGKIITSDTGYASGLKPYGSASQTGYATYFGAEHSAKIRVVEGRE